MGCKPPPGPDTIFSDMLGSLGDFQRRLLKWFDAHRRELPWRRPRQQNGSAAEELDPYHVLVSELMLQQTQVATVIPYFQRFIERLPTIGDLAAAEEQDVLRLWQGLGYYSRARNLRKAAQEIVARHHGNVPRDLESLCALPGVGRYTAGAVASIAFEQSAPILDGNVMRVVCRLDGIRQYPREPATQGEHLMRAAQLVPEKQGGHPNSALMALVPLDCKPRR